MFGDTEISSKLETENSALVSRGPDLEGERRKKPWCDHCKKPWHTRETCWKIHGKPHSKKRHDGRALQTAESSQEQQINSSAAPFTKEQLEHLQKLFQSTQFSNHSCFLAQSGNYLYAALSSVQLNSVSTWIIDYGAPDHMTGCSSLFFIL